MGFPLQRMTHLSILQLEKDVVIDVLRTVSLGVQQDTITCIRLIHQAYSEVLPSRDTSDCLLRNTCMPLNYMCVCVCGCVYVYLQNWAYPFPMNIVVLVLVHVPAYKCPDCSLPVASVFFTYLETCTTLRRMS